MGCFHTGLKRIFNVLLPASFAWAACLPIYAQAPLQATEPAAIAHVAVQVSDLAKSREFYERLGYEEAFALDQGGAPTEAFLKVNDRQFIELYPQRNPSQTVGFLHVCFESEDLEKLNQFYLSRGLTPTPVRRAGAGNLLFTMEGPEKQNIEYTQYMPGSRHTNDRGKHLGADRIANRIAGVGIGMHDPAAASAFYTEKLGFRSTHSFVSGQVAFAIPGDATQQIDFLAPLPDASFELFLAVPNLHSAAAELKARNIPAQKRGKTLAISDPDGNQILFTEARF
jgi:catechol 2,3-dioxygenase-like lactoylglutathione lyase family enzyme